MQILIFRMLRSNADVCRCSFSSLGYLWFRGLELIFAIKTDWFFLLLINCYHFQKVQEKIIIDNTFVFIEYLRVMVMDTYFQIIQRCAYLIQSLKQ